MASVAKDSRGRSPYWMACYTDAAGRRVKKSTGKTNKEEALRIAMQLERAGRLARTGELTEHRARTLLSELLEQISDGRESVRVKPAKAFFGEWLANKRALLSEGSLWSYEAAVNGFVEFLGPRADRPLTAIQTPDVQSYVSSLRKGGLSPKTIGTYTKILRSALKSARLQQLITFNPAEAVDLPKVISGQRGTFTPAEITLLIGAAPTEDWRTVVMLGAFTGQRLRDCCNLEWANVDFTSGMMTFRVSKRGGERLTVPMHPQIKERLEEIAGDQPEKYVAPSLANRETGGQSGLSMGFKRLMEAAGVEAGEGERTGRRKTSARSFHSLRHSFVSMLANAGVSEELRMKLSGHSTAEVHSGYTHHEAATLAAAVAKLPKIET